MKTTMKAKELYIVIGDHDMGKSSVLRHLLGFPKGLAKTSKKFQTKMLRFVNQGDCEVGLQAYCSLQEEHFSPQKFINYVNQSGNAPDKIFLALQLNAASTNQRNTANYYLNYFASHTNWTIVASVLLDTNLQNHLQPCPGFPNCIYVYSSLKGVPVHPTNVVAVDVRRHFGLV